MDEIAISKYVGLAIRAGNVVYGIDNIKKFSKKINLIIYCHTASTNLQKSLSRLVQVNGLPVVQLAEHTLDSLIHTTNCKAIGITNPHLAEQIKLLK